MAGRHLQNPQAWQQWCVVEFLYSDVEGYGPEVTRRPHRVYSKRALIRKETDCAGSGINMERPVDGPVPARDATLHPG